jgi:hypothetical protein
MPKQSLILRLVSLIILLNKENSNLLVKALNQTKKAPIK